MKKPVFLLVVLAIIGFGWWKYSGNLKAVRNGPQGEPARVVTFFFDNIKKLSDLIWKEGAREKAGEEVKKAKSGTPEEQEKATAELYQKYGIEDISVLFAEKRFGKAAAGIFSLYEFGTYSIGGANVEGNKATVEAVLAPVDFMGLEKAFSRLSSAAPQSKLQPITIPFTLEKKNRRWYIVDVGGRAGELAKAAARLRK